MSEAMYDLLETCLQELEQGAEIEQILARYPQSADELRPILQASAQVKALPVTEPSREVVMRGRARLMQQVEEIREGQFAPRKRVIPFLQRLAISFAVTAGLLFGGTTLVGASSSALPGQNLYPVKRGWEDVRLFFTFDEKARKSLEHEIEQERVQEVDDLLSDEEHTQVEFSGVFSSQNGVAYISNIQVLFPAGAQLPQDGTLLHVTGWTTEKGYVEVIKFDILPNGTIVPVIKPMPSATKEPQLEPTNADDDASTAEPTQISTEPTEPAVSTPEPTQVKDGGGSDKEPKDPPDPPEPPEPPDDN